MDYSMPRSVNISECRRKSCLELTLSRKLMLFLEVLVLALAASMLIQSLRALSTKGDAAAPGSSAIHLHTGYDARKNASLP